MLYYLSSDNKMNLPSIISKYLREMVKETRNEAAKMRNSIPVSRLISDILFDRKLVQKHMDIGMTKEVDFVIGKNFNSHTLKNMSLITNIVNPS